MRPDDSNTPFDLDLDEAHDVTQEFWGTTRGWTERGHSSGELPTEPRRRPDDTTGSLRALRDGLAAFRPSVRSDATGSLRRTRQHGIVRSADTPSAPTQSTHLSSAPAQRTTRVEASLGELASGWFDDDGDWSVPSHTSQGHQFDDDDDLIPLAPVQPTSTRPGLGAVDPLLVRVGAVITALVLLVPLAFSLRPNDAQAIQSIPAVVPVGASPTPADVSAAVDGGTPDPTSIVADDAATTESADQATGVLPPSQPDLSETAAEVTAETAAAASEDRSDPPADVVESEATTQSVGVSDDAATVDQIAERQVPECPQTYEAVAGDSWYGIADAAGISPSALLSENGADVDSVILPGDEICLPADATIPSPSVADAPSTTEAPAPVVSTTAPPTTAPPTTTPPTTTPASPSEVQQIVRDVWPDELEERALEIAYRESGYQATAYNGWCCYGVFQIYWSVHQSWLDDFGVYSATDLYDARKNAEAAYALYRGAGGWGPWGG